MSNTKIWLIGAGEMAKEYLKVLNDIEQEVIVIGRGENNCNEISNNFRVKTVAGGLTNFLTSQPELPNKVIVTVGIEALKDTTIELLNYGVKQILLEKPGVGYPSEIDALCEVSNQNNANVLLAYNRRFYASVIKAKEIIKEDGGLSSFNFEFTEWSHIIKTLEKDPAEHQNWFLGNSTHIIDTAFYVGGLPEELAAFVSGENEMDWHKASSNYAGAGISTKKALFSYQANWQAPGRWSIEFLTKKHRLIFRPIEKLQIQDIGSVAIKDVEGVDYTLDEKYKPGLYLQTKFFLEDNTDEFCDINEQKEMIDNYYLKMSNY